MIWFQYVGKLINKFVSVTPHWLETADSYVRETNNKPLTIGIRDQGLHNQDFRE